MYIPYLRGKQFELIALRELSQKNIITNNVIPIIEPVKLSSTLISTIEEFISKGRKIAIIANPNVGQLIKKQDIILKEIKKFLNNDNVYIAHILNENTPYEMDSLLGCKNLIILHLNDQNYEVFNHFFSGKEIKYNIINNINRTYERKLKKITQNFIMLNDRFPSRRRNADYLDEPDEFFSDDHLYYKEEGWVGFSDYSLIANDYSESGFAPYAVAIHISYFDDDNVLRVNHFVSSTNEDYSNTPKKFYEALEKLIEWKQKNRLDSHALREFEDYYSNQRYPGLGSLKKLSIMHHLELISNYLGKKE